MTKTEDFLKEAFAGESQANRKYTAFAAQAEKDGFPQAAKLFERQQRRRQFTPPITCVRLKQSRTLRRTCANLLPGRHMSSKRCTWK